MGLWDGLAVSRCSRLEIKTIQTKKLLCAIRYIRFLLSRLLIVPAVKEAPPTPLSPCTYTLIRVLICIILTGPMMFARRQAKWIILLYCYTDSEARGCLPLLPPLPPHPPHPIQQPNWMNIICGKWHSYYSYTVVLLLSVHQFNWNKYYHTVGILLK